MTAAAGPGTTQRAVTRGEAGQLELREAPVPSLADGEVLTRITVAAVCGSDITSTFYRPAAGVSLPGRPGHEGVGVVSLSRHPAFEPGDLVLVLPRGGEPGTFADYLALPASQLIKLSPDADPALMVTAQQLGTVIFALRRFAPPPRGATLVLGAGPAGQAFVQLLRQQTDLDVTCVDVLEDRLTRAARFGARTIALAGVTALDALLADRPDGYDFVVEAAGTDESRRLAMTCASSGATIGFFGVPVADEITVPFNRLFRREVTIRMAFGAQREPGLASFREAVRAVAEGRVETRSTITHREPLERIQTALERVRDKRDGVLKHLIEVAPR